MMHVRSGEWTSWRISIGQVQWRALHRSCKAPFCLGPVVSHAVLYCQGMVQVMLGNKVRGRNIAMMIIWMLRQMQMGMTARLESLQIQMIWVDRPSMMQVMLGVDRLDMIKGIPQKLLAFEKFLEEHPQWRDKVLLVQIAVPSRTDVPEYQVPSSLLSACKQP